MSDLAALLVVLDAATLVEAQAYSSPTFPSLAAPARAFHESLR